MVTQTRGEHTGKDNMKTWYKANTGGHQGLVIEEGTGRNVAVTYEEKDAELIAAAPDLLRAAVAALTVVNREQADGSIAYDLRAAIARAEGRC